jgi:hypothetical protein
MVTVVSGGVSTKGLSTVVTLVGVLFTSVLLVV